MTIMVTLDAGGIPAPTVAGSPVLFLDPRDGDGEWSTLLPDGTVVNDRSVASDPTPVNYGPLITALGAVAHALNADSSDASYCRITQALTPDKEHVPCPTP